MIHNAEISVEWIVNQLIPLLTDTDRVVAMSEAAARMGRRDADMALAREVMAIARGDRPTPEMPLADDDAEDAYYDDGKDAR